MAKKSSLKHIGNMAHIRGKEEKIKSGGINLLVTCERCGKPIEVTNKYGMFCEDLCGLKEAKAALRELDALCKKQVKKWGKNWKKAK